MTSNFITISKNGTHELEIKKSRFIATAFRIQNETDALNFIDQIKLNHRKANHHCFAYMIGNDNYIQRASDDGEPSGTAGVPILEVLQKKDVHNVLVVVTRYFGGIKLGAGGLIRAYSNSTSKVLDEVGLVERIEQTTLVLTIDYSQYDPVTHWLSTHDLIVQNTQYAEKITITIPVITEHIEQFKQNITNLLNGHVTFQTTGKQFNEVPVKK